MLVRRHVLIIIFIINSMLFGNNLLRNAIEALASPYLTDEIKRVWLFVVQDGLDDGLEGRVSCLQVINIVLVYTFSAVVGVGVVDAFCPVYLGACSTCRRVAITLALSLAVERTSCQRINLK